ncbi:MAG: hypothetical protein RLN75_05795, partial [Longimicrobiales bacterium]
DETPMESLVQQIEGLLGNGLQQGRPVREIPVERRRRHTQVTSDGTQREVEEAMAEEVVTGNLQDPFPRRHREPPRWNVGPRCS